MKLPHIYSKLAPFFRPFGLPYALIMRQRRALYRKGFLSGYVPACPVVSIGNISFGGTGKTPLTAWLLNWAEEQGLRAAVLTRGYKGAPGKRPLLVRRDTPVEQSGDEPLLLARAFAKASVVVFPKRAEAARFAENYLAPDLFILDDGMQHLAVRRDLDIVLFSKRDLQEEWGRVIPSGTWREGGSALRAASAFAVKADEREFHKVLPAARKRLARFGKPFFSFTLVPSGLRPVFPRQGRNNPLLGPEVYTGRPYVLVSGVGNPEQVEDTALQLIGRPPVLHFEYDDHHAYTENDVRGLLAKCPVPMPVVCTAKDAVKLKYFSEAWGGTPLWTLETRVAFGPAVDFAGENAPVFSEWWESWWREKTTTPDTKALA